MSSALENVLTQITDHTAALESDLHALGESLRAADPGVAHKTFNDIHRHLIRMIDAARAVRDACPNCGGDQNKKNWEQVNVLSGVWKLPRCNLCTRLAAFLDGVEQIARTSPPER